VAWLALLNGFMVFIAALLYVQTDELRVIWFFLNLPAVFLLLGRLVGLLATIASALCIIICNRYLLTPYSPNAIATALVAFCYVGAFFYAYASRPISYFQRMVESNEKLRYMASHDALTGVLNARTYYDICDRLILLALRDNSPFSVLFIDLDHFKMVNDTYGHDAGDTVLKTVAACLAEHSRESDLLARIGGEEFSMFLPGTPLQGAMALAEKLRVAVEQSMPAVGSTRLKVTASIGVAINQSHHQQIAAIQSEADQAMYAAKRQGRNRVSCLSGLNLEPALQIG
jgi:diguanylate cyclase (GGDEF)-like protein